MIKKVGDKYCLYTKDGSRKLGEHDTREEAEAQERAIEAAKHRRGGDDGQEEEDDKDKYRRGAEDVEPCPDGEMRHLHLRGATGKARTEVLDGREYLVVPVVALMEGVIHAVNASVPEFVSAETLRRAATSWNGRPVVLGHPVKNGTQCSANDPAVIEARGLGRVYNSRFEGGKLLQEAWIDKAKARRLEPKMLARLEANEMEEVSVGAVVGTDGVAGSFNGKPYKASWLSTAGDHLAFLPGGRGACSIEMGCGAMRAATMRVLENALEPVDLTAQERAEQTIGDLRSAIGARNSAMDLKTIQALHDGAVALGAACGQERETYLTGLSGKSLDERVQAVNTAVQKQWGSGTGLQPSSSFAYAQMVYDDHVIVRRDDKMFRVPYTVSADGVTFSDEGIVEVRQEFVPVAAKRDLAAGKYKDCPSCDGSGSKDGNPCEACEGDGKLKAAEAKADAISPAADDLDRQLADKAAAGDAAFRAACGCQGDKHMTTEQKAELIKSLVADKYSGFTAGDEKMLEVVSDERLESFKVAAESRAAQERDLRAAAERKLTPEEFMQVAPPELKALITRSQRQETELKAALITELKAAQAEYSEAELSVKSVEELQRLARVAKIDERKIDYSGRGIPRAASALDEEEEDYTPPNPYEAGIKALQQREQKPVAH